MIGYELAQHHREPNIAWISFVLYPAGWLACMFSAASGRPWLGAIYAVLVMVVHVFGARPWESEFVLLLAASVLGACSESWLLHQRAKLPYPASIQLRHRAARCGTAP